MRIYCVMHIQLRFLIHSEMINTNNKTITLSAISFNFHCPIATLREWVVSSHLISSHRAFRLLYISLRHADKAMQDSDRSNTTSHSSPWDPFVLSIKPRPTHAFLPWLDWIRFDGHLQRYSTHEKRPDKRAMSLPSGLPQFRRNFYCRRAPCGALYCISILLL